MSIGKYLTGGAWAAMAAALAIASVPSAASEDSGRRWERGGNARGEARAARPERDPPQGNALPRERARESWRANNGGEARPARQQPPVQRAQPPVRSGPQSGVPQPGGGNWNRSGDANRGQRGDGRNWNRSGNDGNRDWARSRDDSSRGETRSDGAQRSGGWSRGPNTGGTVANTDRNGSYTDRDRNRSYDGRRDNDRNRGDRNRGDRNWGDRDRDNRDWGDRNRGDRNWGDRIGSYRDGHRDARRDHRRWDNRSWRNDRRYDWNRYRAANRSVFRLGAYYSPYRNYSYRRLSIGFMLDSLFYSNRYWINDPWRYRLPEVYGPYRWVRYYDDALLVDVYSGEVVDVIHDFFW